MCGPYYYYVWVCVWVWVWIVGVEGGSTPIHPVLADLLNTPVSPRPSLRSQLRGAATDPRGKTVLKVEEGSLCTNDLVFLEEEQRQGEVVRARRVLGRRGVPAHHLVLLLQVFPHAARIFVQGFQTELHSDVNKKDEGVITIATVHPTTGRLLRLYNHPAHAHVHPLHAFLSTLSSDKVMVVAASVWNVHNSVIQYLQDSVGVSVPMISNNEGVGVVWAWVVGVSGRVVEVGSTQGGVSVELHLHKLPAGESWCDSDSLPPRDDSWAARVELCTDYDGYGEWCTCPPIPSPWQPTVQRPPLPWQPEVQRPASPWQPIVQRQPSPWQPKAQVNSEAGDTITIILASHPTALYRLLVSVSEAGGKLTDILVFTSRPTTELQLITTTPSSTPPTTPTPTPPPTSILPPPTPTPTPPPTSILPPPPPPPPPSPPPPPPTPPPPPSPTLILPHLQTTQHPTTTPPLPQPTTTTPPLPRHPTTTPPLPQLPPLPPLCLRNTYLTLRVN
ncbi:hypothetical protein Pmani_023408 [Petrolisthes manimaculis]|uniref:Uncharacterized protein n=1 Tax=Petrolisthes manimaculis TaxID=1843537 RepID=A0AAE1PCB7_9EUCA|nr:hypothetical protein Pmani_023408 [Petrolisthes manimaculis]